MEFLCTGISSFCFADHSLLENAKAEEWMGLRSFYLYHCRKINRGGGENELWPGSYGSVAGVYGC